MKQYGKIMTLIKQIAKESKYAKRFEELDRSKMELEPGEEIKHCLDHISFGGIFYHPEWVVTNKGRTWSLVSNRWMVPQIVKSGKNSCWAYTTKIPGKKTTYVHLLVLCYFADESDKIALEEFGEMGVHGHHIFAIVIPGYLKGTGNQKEKIDRCMKDSCKTNLAYQEKDIDHRNDTAMANGGITVEEKNGKAEWDQEMKDIRRMMYSSGTMMGNYYGTYYVYSYDTDGNLVKTLKQKSQIKGAINPKYDVILGKYRVNADEFTDLILENQEEILERIEKNPPTDYEYNYKKNMVINGNLSIFYALNEKECYVA